MPFVDWVLAESSGPQLGREAVVEAAMERSMSRGGGVEKKHFGERKNRRFSTRNLKCMGKRMNEKVVTHIVENSQGPLRSLLSRDL